MAKEIENIEDIRSLVDTFYERVRQNTILGPVFEEKIGNDWEPHLEKMYRFWQTVALQEHTYMGNPFMAHTSLPIEKIHFEQWLALFKSTVDELFSGERAEEVKKRASFMAEMFELKLKNIRQENSSSAHT